MFLTGVFTVFLNYTLFLECALGSFIVFLDARGPLF